MRIKAEASGDRAHRCFLIGHRDADESLTPALDAAIERHITECGVTEFVVGHYGNFDRLAARALARARARHPEIRLFLLTPYYSPEHPLPLPEGFDATLYPEGIEDAPRRLAIVYANRYMVEASLYLIAFVRHSFGNTGKLLAYAQGRCQIERI